MDFTGLTSYRGCLKSMNLETLEQKGERPCAFGCRGGLSLEVKGTFIQGLWITSVPHGKVGLKGDEVLFWPGSELDSEGSYLRQVS